MAQSYKKADFVRKSIQFCLDQGVIIDLLLLDRGFFAVDVTNTINDMGVDRLMPCTNTSGVVEALQDHKSGRRDAVAPYTLTSLSGKTATFHMHITKRRKVRKKSKTKGKSQEFVAPDCVRAANAQDKLIGFASSLTDIDIKKYDCRWMIETSFCVVEENRPRQDATQTRPTSFVSCSV